MLYIKHQNKWQMEQRLIKKYETIQVPEDNISEVPYKPLVWKSFSFYDLKFRSNEIKS